MSADAANARVNLLGLPKAELEAYVGELGAEILGEVRHGRDVALAALVHPVHELARAEGFAAHRCDECFQLGLRQA